jgi:CubicO group peptidase (beta-lactamase class C family)
MDVKKTKVMLVPFAERILNEWRIPGLVALTIRNGEIDEVIELGILRSGGEEKISKYSIFQIASLTKSFTTTALACLVDDGILQWEDPVQKYLPQFSRPNTSIAENTTICDLLAHRTDFPGMDIQRRLLSGMDFHGILEELPHLPSEEGFRSGFNYQEFGYQLAAEILYRCSGSTLEKFIYQRIFRPLGMYKSGFGIIDMQAYKSVAQPHLLINKQWKVLSLVDLHSVYAGGGIFSNLEDLAFWMQFNLGNGEWNHHRILSFSSKSMLYSPKIYLDPERDSGWKQYFNIFDRLSYGLGWFIARYDGFDIVLHGGNFPGMSSLMVLLPKEKSGIITLSNLRAPWALFALALSFIDRCLGINRVDWSSKFREEKNY